MKARGITDVVIAPVGFVSDHMEVLYDLDTEAHTLSKDIDLNMVRAATVGAHPTFISMIRELILERMTENPDRRALGIYGASHDVCPVDCCLIKSGVESLESRATNSRASVNSNRIS